VAAGGLLLSGCESMLLPDFNGGLLNPDIRFLKAGEVMNGVKCAMTAFMIERERQLLKERIAAVENRDRDNEASRRFLLLYGAEYKQPFGAVSGRILAGDQTVLAENKTGKDNQLNPFALGTDKATNPPGPLSRLCWPMEYELNSRAAGFDIGTAIVAH
jgi:hypothetical protein